MKPSIHRTETAAHLEPTARRYPRNHSIRLGGQPSQSNRTLQAFSSHSERLPQNAREEQRLHVRKSNGRVVISNEQSSFHRDSDATYSQQRYAPNDSELFDSSNNDEDDFASDGEGSDFDRVPHEEPITQSYRSNTQMPPQLPETSLYAVDKQRGSSQTRHRTDTPKNPMRSNAIPADSRRNLESRQSRREMARDEDEVIDLLSDSEDSYIDRRVRGASRPPNSAVVSRRGHANIAPTGFYQEESVSKSVTRPNARHHTLNQPQNEYPRYARDNSGLTQDLRQNTRERIDYAERSHSGKSRAQSPARGIVKTERSQKRAQLAATNIGSFNPSKMRAPEVIGPQYSHDEPVEPFQEHNRHNRPLKRGFDRIRDPEDHLGYVQASTFDDTPELQHGSASSIYSKKVRFEDVHGEQRQRLQQDIADRISGASKSRSLRAQALQQKYAGTSSNSRHIPMEVDDGDSVSATDGTEHWQGDSVVRPAHQPLSHHSVNDTHVSTATTANGNSKKAQHSAHDISSTAPASMASVDRTKQNVTTKPQQPAGNLATLRPNVKALIAKAQARNRALKTDGDQMPRVIGRTPVAKTSKAKSSRPNPAAVEEHEADRTVEVPPLQKQKRPNTSATKKLVQPSPNNDTSMPIKCIDSPQDQVLKQVQNEIQVPCSDEEQEICQMDTSVPGGDANITEAPTANDSSKSGDVSTPSLGLYPPDVSAEESSLVGACQTGNDTNRPEQSKAETNKKANADAVLAAMRKIPAKKEIHQPSNESDRSNKPGCSTSGNDSASSDADMQDASTQPPTHNPKEAEIGETFVERSTAGQNTDEHSCEPLQPDMTKPLEVAHDAIPPTLNTALEVNTDQPDLQHVELSRIPHESPQSDDTDTDTRTARAEEGELKQQQLQEQHKLQDHQREETQSEEIHSTQDASTAKEQEQGRRSESRDAEEKIRAAKEKERAAAEKLKAAEEKKREQEQKQAAEEKRKDAEARRKEKEVLKAAPRETTPAPKSTSASSGTNRPFSLQKLLNEATSGSSHLITPPLDDRRKEGYPQEERLRNERNGQKRTSETTPFATGTNAVEVGARKAARQSSEAPRQAERQAHDLIKEKPTLKPSPKMESRLRSRPPKKKPGKVLPDIPRLTAEQVQLRKQERKARVNSNLQHSKAVKSKPQPAEIEEPVEKPSATARPNISAPAKVLTPPRDVANEGTASFDDLFDSPDEDGDRNSQAKWHQQLVQWRAEKRKWSDIVVLWKKLTNNSVSQTTLQSLLKKIQAGEGDVVCKATQRSTVTSAPSKGQGVTTKEVSSKSTRSEVGKAPPHNPKAVSNAFPKALQTSARTTTTREKQKSVQESLPAKDPPAAKAVNPARPTTGGKCLSDAAVQAYLATLDALPTSEDEADVDTLLIDGPPEEDDDGFFIESDPLPPTEDECFWVYQVKRKAWKHDEAEEDTGWYIVGPQHHYESVREANEAASKESYRVRFNHSLGPDVIEFSTKIYKDRMFLIQWTTPSGHTKIMVDRYLRLPGDGPKPRTTKYWVPMKVYEVKQKRTTVTRDPDPEDPGNEFENEEETTVDGGMIYTILGQANRAAATMMLDLTTKPASGRINDIQHRVAEQQRWDEKCRELEELETGFREIVKVDEQTTVEVWVCEKTIKGPRNI